MKVSTKAMVYIALIAAVYVTITSMQLGIGFGAVQVRVAESLNLLAFFNPIFLPAVALGVFITNLLWSPFGLVDVGLGTLATVIAILLVMATKKATKTWLKPEIGLAVAAIWPVLINALIIPVVIIYGGGGWEGGFSWAAFWGLAWSVGLGQFIAVILLGYTLFLVLMRKFPHFITRIKNL